jgi:DNA mismatch endonuclease (patch repair protein)
MLDRRGHRFRKNVLIPLAEMSVRPDVVFTRVKVAFFVDGCFWHACPEHGDLPRSNNGYWMPKLERNVRRDRLVDERLRVAGWIVVRLW